MSFKPIYTKCVVKKNDLESVLADEITNIRRGNFCDGSILIGRIDNVSVVVKVTSDDDEVDGMENLNLLKIEDSDKQ